MNSSLNIPRSFIDLITLSNFQSPEILFNKEIDIEYVSPAALAQKGKELNSLIRGLEIFGQIGSV